MGTVSAIARDEKSRFRVTASAAGPHAEPLVFPWEVELEDEEIVRYGEPIGTPLRLPPDFYLREIREVDIDNRRDLVELVRTYGRIGWPVEVPMLLSPTRFKGAGSHRTTIAEVRGHIAALRWATDIWMSSRNGVLENTNEAESLIEILNAGLRGFSPFVWAHGVTADLGEFGAPFPPSAYGAACLQLFNDVVAGAPYRRCANPNCGRLFVRQRGRAEYDQYRLRGVKYCNYLCARAKAQRDYRKRHEGGG
jgi:hypothetical protein